ncbi:MAG: ECF transporter S component [Promethearchaeota archaeon]
MNKAEIVDLEEKKSFMSKRSQLTLQITGAAIFGALSIVVSGIVVPILPRIPGWGIAYFDPTSIIWITCFLIFGITAGLLCCAIGTFGLLIFDPTGIGSIFKFFAAISLIIVPILVLKLYKKQEGVRNSQKLKDHRNYLVIGILGTTLRIILMLILNILFFLTIWADFYQFANLEFAGFAGVTGWTAIIVGTIIINGYSSVIDLLIPYLIVFGAKLDEKFEIW